MTRHGTAAGRPEGRSACVPRRPTPDCDRRSAAPFKERCPARKGAGAPQKGSDRIGSGDHESSPNTLCVTVCPVCRGPGQGLASSHKAGPGRP